jgi:hypothetical protein
MYITVIFRRNGVHWEGAKALDSATLHTATLICIVRLIYRATTLSHWTALHPHQYFKWNLYNRMCPPSPSFSLKHGIYNVCFITGMTSTHCATKPQNPIYTLDAGHKNLKHDN